MIKHHPFQTHHKQNSLFSIKRALAYSRARKDASNDITAETYTTSEHLTSTSDIFKSCTWTSCSSTEAGGAIYLQSSYPLTVIDCSFLSCKSKPTSLPYGSGGGAIAFLSTGLLSISSTSFISCSALGERGGAIHIHGTGDVVISSSLIFDCSCSTFGGGLLTEYGTSLTLSNSMFILCRTQFGGACGFHTRKPIFSVSNCIFAKNQASGSTRGGGAIEDYNYNPNSYCQYYCSFFTENTASNGNDIAANGYAYSSSPLIHCFTTTKENSFSNLGTYKDNWLPQARM